MLRGNKIKPGNMVKTLSNVDPKTQLIPTSIHGDPRTNFICLEFPAFIEHIDSINGENQDQLNESLNNFVGEILNAKVIFNTIRDEIAVPNFILTYRNDFGKSDRSIIEFIYRYLEKPEIDMNKAIKGVVAQQLWLISL